MLFISVTEYVTTPLKSLVEWNKNLKYNMNKWIWHIKMTVFWVVVSESGPISVVVITSEEVNYAPNVVQCSELSLENSLKEYFLWR